MPLDNLFSDDLRTSNWLGKVIDNQDPDFEGKVKVRVFGKFDDILDEDLPWARPTNRITAGGSTGSGFHSVPKIDSVIGITFDNGDIYEPEYFYLQHVSDELKAEIEGSYTNAHSLIYDTETDGSVKVFFTEEKGLMLDYKETQINIKPDNSMTVVNPNGDSIVLNNDGTVIITTSKQATVKSPSVIIDAANTIELGKGATEKLVLGDSFMALFNAHTHIGNLGAPTTPPIVPMTPAQLSQKPKVTTK
jgi:hypothetical protein